MSALHSLYKSRAGYLQQRLIQQVPVYTYQGEEQGRSLLEQPGGTATPRGQLLTSGAVEQGAIAPTLTDGPLTGILGLPHTPTRSTRRINEKANPYAGIIHELIPNFPETGFYAYAITGIQDEPILTPQQTYPQSTPENLIATRHRYICKPNLIEIRLFSIRLIGQQARDEFTLTAHTCKIPIPYRHTPPTWEEMPPQPTANLNTVTEVREFLSIAGGSFYSVGVPHNTTTTQSFNIRFYPWPPSTQNELTKTIRVKKTSLQTALTINKYDEIACF